ncbi:hypothetical protein [Rhodococcus sp. 14-2496-1d]|uniref:hypothetical protein n=1 Tax=Rhodococcus sp. 14-2496-1d TaxID=2023146 RepID=UPI00117A368B|nr:hypothetical protein [Rhodococcus sp. 14-2496-1d]
MSAPERNDMRFLLSPDKRSRRLFRPEASQVQAGMQDEMARRDDERQRAQDVRDAARLATLWMRDAIRAIEDLDYVDRVGFLSEGIDRLDAVAAELNQRLDRLQSALRSVLDSAPSRPPHLGTLRGRECSKQGTVDPLVVAALASAAVFGDMSGSQHAFEETVSTYARMAEGLSGNAALRMESEVPKPGQHLKYRPSGKPAGLSDRHGGALNSTAAPDGSGPGGGG